MARLLFFAVIGVLIWFAARLVSQRRPRSDAPDRAPEPSAPPVSTLPQCAWCGVHVATDFAVALPDGRTYCGPAHRDAALVAAGTDERS